MTLGRSDPEGGLNLFVAAVLAGGVPGLLSPVAVVDCDDCAQPPPRSPTLALDAAGVLSWAPPAGDLAYDAVRGDLAALRSTGSWGASVRVCLADDDASASLLEGAAPARGYAWYYLVRGVGCGGAGTWDDGGGTGPAATRDPSLDDAASSCP